MTKTSFERHLFLVFWGLFIAQNGLFALILWSVGVPFSDPAAYTFFPVNAAYSLFIYAMLLLQKKYFKNSLTGLPLEKVSWPNFLTLVRGTSLASLSFLFLLTRRFPGLSLALVIFVTVAFLTDLLDGWLSRKLGEISDLGKILDSSTDYVVLFALALVLGIGGVLPLWLFALIVFRLVWQTGITALLAWRLGSPVLETTFLGKASFFAIMVLFTLEILVYFRIPGLENHWAIGYYEYFTAALVGVSLVDKGLFLLRKWGPSKT